MPFLVPPKKPKMGHFGGFRLFWGYRKTQCKIEFTFQSQKPPNLKVVEMALNAQCYQYLWLTYDFIQKESKETLKKTKSLILQCKFGSRAKNDQKLSKNGSLNRDLLNFL